VSKSFGPVQALTDVDLDVPAGAVTALAGDNGAGKSTLIKCIAGIHPPDSGEVLWEGQPARIHAPADAAALGIQTVYQDLALCDNLDIVQNMFLGRERLRRGQLRQRLEEREDLHWRGVGRACERDCGDRGCTERDGARIGLEGVQIEHLIAPVCPVSLLTAAPFRCSVA